MDLALNNLQKLICYKNQPTNQPTKQIYLTHRIYLTLTGTTTDGHHQIQFRVILEPTPRTLKWGAQDILSAYSKPNRQGE